MKIIHQEDGSEIHTPFMTLAEASQYCGLDRRKMVPLMDRDSVPYYAKGRCRIYDCRNLDAWMTRRSTP
jgi:hypothetical protein